MQTVRILQAVKITMIMGLIASCSASKEYSTKLFAPRTPLVKDSQLIAFKFLELDNLEKDKDNLVSTDVIMGRDTATNTETLDNLAKTFPSKTDASNKSDKIKTPREIAEYKMIITDSVAVAKSSNPGDVRNKRTRD